MHDFSKDACLLTDFYQLTMAQAYFDQKRHQTEAVFHLFFRKNPFQGNWSLAAGIDDALNFIADLRFSTDAIDYLSSLTLQNRPLFSKEFLSFLAHSDARVDVTGMGDGQYVFPNEPLLRVQGPLFLCQLLETPLLNIVNFQTLIATKARRIKFAAREKGVIDFGLRRAQGFDGGVTATKAAYIGGVDKTSNVWAAKHFDIEPSGTLAHSFIMSYDSQAQAFEDFCASFKDSAVLLVDTYDPIKGIDDAVATFLRLKASGHRPLGVRIDSGDINHLSKVARNALDRAGLRECKIIVSGDLDEYVIDKLEEEQAPIDIYGVGTRLVTAHDDPALSGVFKLASIFEHGNYRNTFKASSRDKLSWPGHQSVARFFAHGKLQFDVIYDVRFDLAQPNFHTFDERIDLHTPLMKQGNKLEHPSLLDKRNAAQRNFCTLPSHLRSLAKAAQAYPVYFDDNIAHKT